MTPDIFEENLVAEIAAIFTGYTLKNSAGNETAINVFAQDVPIKSDEDSEDTENSSNPPEPYIVVKTNAGNIASEDDPHVVTTVIVVCVYDDSVKKQGSRDIRHIIHKIYERFAKDPRLGSAVMKYPIDWIIEDEDTYPYYFGGMQLQFELPAIKREDPLA